MINSRANSLNYTTVTEIPNVRASGEQMGRLYSRYRFASEYCDNRDVLEVACGAGIGLGYLAKTARRVVGGDIDKNNLSFALDTYAGRNNIEVTALDAHDLHFDKDSFDVVICYEALYYLEQPERFIEEAHRILRRGGVLIICLANKDWTGFNPSPYSYNYFSVPELYSLLHKGGFDVSIFADSPVDDGGFKNRVINFIKRTAVRLHLIPKTMKGKERLKRLFCGKLYPLPSEITDGMADYTPPVQISHKGNNTQFKVVFAVGHVK